MQNQRTAPSSTYEIPKEVIDSILAQAGLESLTGDVIPLDDDVSQR